MSKAQSMGVGVVVGAFLGLGVAAPTEAHAQGLPGQYSDSQAVNFTHQENGFENVSWDSGYFPTNSALQVKLIAQLDGTTKVDMGGDALTEWPTALDVSVPGRADAGLLKLDYVPTLQAEYKLETTIKIGPFSFPINQTGTLNLPVGPIENLKVDAETVFTPFVLPGADPRPVTAVQKHGPQLIPVDVVQFTVSGLTFSLAIELYAALEMSADYQSLDMSVLPATNLITQEGGSVLVSPTNPATGFGPFQKLSIQPRGTLEYTGELVFTANAVLSANNFSTSYPLGEEIVPLTNSESKTDFNVEDVTVPLPDLGLVEVSHDGIATQTGALIFGDAESGVSVSKTLTVNNKGQSELLVETTSDSGTFTLISDKTIAIAPGGSSIIEIAFTPGAATPFTGNLNLTTNDPDLPSLTVPMSGNGLAPPSGGDTTGTGGGNEPSIDTAAGCGCRVVTRSSPGTGAAALLLLGIAFGARRRRRPENKKQ